MAKISDNYIAVLRQALRINHTHLDGEIVDLIEAARADLILGGILPSRANDETDPLIKRAVLVYAKSEFGLENTDSEKYRESYNILKRHLMLSSEYISTEG